MRRTQFFMPTLKENPSEAQIVSHRLMLRAGMVRQCSAGIYTWLPLGLRVLRRIERVVREEQDKAGACEVLMPTLQSADLWRESGRYDAYGPEMLRMKDRHERDLLYGPTNEEMITDIVRQSVHSYKQLPQLLYHIQWKFRDEVRPRFGVMRGREFLMKDAYSFDLTPEAARQSYTNMFAAYLRTFARLGLRAVPVRADTGPIGGDLSHEFLILAETGESALYYDADLQNVLQQSADAQEIVARCMQHYAAADEMHNAAQFEAQVPEQRRMSGRGIEVGHIFYFGTKYSQPMKAVFTAADGSTQTMEMGSYGIGVSRLVGAAIEANHDDKGIVWPLAMAPFAVAVVNLKVGNAECDGLAQNLYAQLQNAGVDTLYHDTTDSAGAKFAECDLIGLPYQAIVGIKNAPQGLVEIKNRATGDVQVLALADAVRFLQQHAIAA